jgi:hypothetical protein
MIDQDIEGRLQSLEEEQLSAVLHYMLGSENHGWYSEKKARLTSRKGCQAFTRFAHDDRKNSF